MRHQRPPSTTPPLPLLRTAATLLLLLLGTLLLLPVMVAGRIGPPRMIPLTVAAACRSTAPGAAAFLLAPSSRRLHCHFRAQITIPPWPSISTTTTTSAAGGGDGGVWRRTGAVRSFGAASASDSGGGGGGRRREEEGDGVSDAAAGGGVRINKCFAAFASRREADKFVAAGRVQVNGQLAEPGIRVQAGDTVALDGRTIEWEKHVLLPPSPSPSSSSLGKRRDGRRGDGGENNGRVYIKYWKPRGVICTTDESVHGNIVRAVDFPDRKRIFPVGRLDKESTGLILLTNDGRVPNAVLRSSLNHRKTYKVRVNRPIDDDDLTQLRSGVTITTPIQRDRVDRLVTAKTLPCEVTRIGARVFEIVLREGRNRQIRRMAEALGYRVTDLHREKVMDIDLRGLRREGEWCPLDEGEMGLIAEALRVYEAAARGVGGGGGGGEGREDEEKGGEEEEAEDD